MYPTLKPNDRLILNRIVRTTKTMPNRGDIVTLEAPIEVETTGFELDEEGQIKTLEGQDALAKYNVYVSTKSACSDEDSLSESVLNLTNDKERAKSSIRISLSYLTTKEEIDFANFSKSSLLIVVAWRFPPSQITDSVLLDLEKGSN